jgi:hypothetical protein
MTRRRIRKNVSPWVLPVVLTSGLLIAGGILAVQAVRRRRLAPDVAPGEVEGKIDNWGYPAQDIRLDEGAVTTPETGITKPWRIYQSVTEGTFYGAYRTPWGGGTVNSPYRPGNAPAQPWGIDEVRQRTIDEANTRQ